MNDLQTFGTTQTNNMTPIEVALQMDADGMTSARKLFDFLEMNPAHFARWCKTNIIGNPFSEENVDFVPLTIEGERNPNPMTDYKLSIAFAKKLAMQSGSPKGEVAREYFVKCEQGLADVAKRQRDILSTMGINSRFMYQIAESMQELETVNAELKAENEELKPMAAYANAVTKAVNNVPIKELSTYLCKNGVMIGRNKLFEKMRADGYLCKDTASRNLPTQKALDMELLTVKQGYYLKEGNIETASTPYVTAKGMEYFMRRYGAVRENNSLLTLR